MNFLTSVSQLFSIKYGHFFSGNFILKLGHCEQWMWMAPLWDVLSWRVHCSANSYSGIWNVIAVFLDCNLFDILRRSSRAGTCPSKYNTIAWFQISYILIDAFRILLVRLLYHASWYTYVRKTNRMHIFLNNLFHFKLSSTCFQQVIVHHQEEFCTGNWQYLFNVFHPELLQHINTTCQSITQHFILYTIKIVQCQGDMFRPLLGHLQALWENRSKSCLYFNVLWDFVRIFFRSLHLKSGKKGTTQYNRPWKTTDTTTMSLKIGSRKENRKKIRTKSHNALKYGSVFPEDTKMT
jgi:hypothetical protein